MKMTSIVHLNKEFLAYCKFEKNLSPKTIKFYGIDLQQFVGFLDQNNYPREITSISKIYIKEYIQSISKAKPKTIKRKIATVKALFNYLEYEDKIVINPFRKIRMQIREPKKLPNVMNILEVERIILSAYKAKVKAFNRNKNGYAFSEKIRDTAVLELLFATGIRVSELSNLNSDCIDLHFGQIKVRGKGNKERIIQVCNKEAIRALKEYQEIFEDAIEKSGFFFVNRFNKRLSEQSIRFLVKRLANEAGLQRRITPHSFRHSFATLLLEQDVDIKYIQHLLGHSSIMTTQIYTHVNSEKQKQILQHHPRKKFRIKQKSLAIRMQDN